MKHIVTRDELRSQVLGAVDAFGYPVFVRGRHYVEPDDPAGEGFIVPINSPEELDRRIDEMMRWDVMADKQLELGAWHHEPCPSASLPDQRAAIAENI